MEIDLGSVFVGIFTILVCLLPFLMMYRSRKKRENRMIDALHQEAKKMKCQLSQIELVSTVALGIDEGRNMLFYCHTIEENLEVQSVNLDDYNSCSIVTLNRMIKRGERNESLIEKLELKFDPKKLKVSRSLEFFDADKTHHLYGELQLLEKWNQMLNSKYKLRIQ